ncbi:hypothetical protein [Chryseobacterium sp. Alg-005]|uniref:hypothetical protein n=1 Tax=Chryseobacterium sp. Alg-005 TaxID=3159516 RepID=UPI0036F2A2FF
MIKRNLLLIFCLIFVTALSQNRKQAIDLKIKNDYTHVWTKTLFPTLWSGFQREAVFSYDLKNKHIAVSYVQQISKKSKTVINIYLYPKEMVDNQLLRDEFYSYDYVLNQNSNKNIELKPLFGNLSNDSLRVNYIYTVFNNSMGQSDFFKGVKYVNKNSLLSIYECGGWGFKIRISSDEMTEGQLKELKNKAEQYFNVLQIASIKTLPKYDAPGILLSPVVKRDSMMIKAISEAARAKIDWMARNLDRKDFLTGFNDVNIDSEVYSLQKMLEYYKIHEKDGEMTDDTKKYFAEMIRISESDRLKDHIYEKYHGIINYPEGESRKADYIQFKIDKNISENTNEIFYKIFYELE